MRFDLIKVLLVDDNGHMRILLAEVLRAIGVRLIFEAVDGPDALRQLRLYPIDVVMTDLAMEPLDGIDLVRQIRNAPDSPAPMVPVIMITGHSTARRVAEARDVGVNGFLSKPISARGIIEQLTEVIQHPRSFVRSETYFGPCRRRRQDPAYEGVLRRETDTPLELEA